MPNMFSFHRVPVEKVHSVIMSLRDSKSRDVYNVNSYIIQSSSFHISEVLVHIFHFCINSG